MARVALYNKYRPSTTDELVGQESIVKIINREIENNSLPNVILFCGGAGRGKTSLARIICSKLDCEKIETDGAKDNGVGDVRRIIDYTKQRSITNKYKVVIIDEFHMITDAGQNALLKIFEDCPEYLIFILCTTEPERILPTILSRCQQFKLNKIPTNLIEERLKFICDSEKKNNPEIQYQDEAIQYIAKLAKGGMRSAISMLDTCLSLSSNLTVNSIMEALGVSNVDIFRDLLYGLYNTKYNEDATKREENVKFVINILEKVYEQGQNLLTFVEEFQDFLTDVAKFKCFNSFLNTDLPQTKEMQDDLALYNKKGIVFLMDKFQTYITTLNKQETNLLKSFERFVMLLNKE